MPLDSHGLDYRSQVVGYDDQARRSTTKQDYARCGATYEIDDRHDFRKSRRLLTSHAFAKRIRNGTFIGISINRSAGESTANRPPSYSHVSSSGAARVVRDNAYRQSVAGIANPANHREARAIRKCSRAGKGEACNTQGLRAWRSTRVT